MNHFPRLGIIAVLMVALAALMASAQSGSGCCCNLTLGTVFPNSYQPASACTDGYKDFVIPTALDIAAGKPCSDKCLETASIPPSPGGACSSADYAPAPKDFGVAPVKGQRALKLTWTAECPADAYDIRRCTGATCTTFQPVAVIGSTTSFTDGTNLLWNTDYSYRIIAKYSIAGDSAPVIESANTGDLECENQFSDQSFCLSFLSYYQFKPYLQAYGYAGTAPPTPASAFADSTFDAKVKEVFFVNFNSSVHCQDDNKLTILNSCTGQGNVCVTQGLTSKCISAGPCQPNQGIFGLGATVDGCEGNDMSPKYCFLDKSATSVDNCYVCSQALNCYDYKSEGACTRNNCGLGNCVWRDTFSDFGAGVCVDDRFSNCKLCNKQGTAGAPNSNAYNVIFDQCSPLKAQKLSNPSFTCFYSNGQALDCSELTCNEFTTPEQCASPAGGITLNSDNSIATPSTDTCGIKVCQYNANSPITCRKNADGTPATNISWPDCSLNDTVCERDYFPPLTTLIPIGGAGKFEYLDIRIWDRSNFTDFGHLAQPKGTTQFCVGACTQGIPQLSNWSTLLCAGPQGGASCTAFAATNYTQLNFNDLEVKQGNKTILTLASGWNTLRYYSRDPSKNVEIIKNFSVFACSACQGPKLIDINITPGRKVNNTFYTKSLSPTVYVSYNEPAEQTFAGFILGSTTTALDESPSSGFNYGYTLKLPSGSSLAQGQYIFSGNARDSNNVFMDAPISVPVVVDTTPPLANYTPVNDAVITTAGALQVKVNFSEPVIVENFTIVEFIVYDTPAGPIRVPQTRDITKLFVKGADNRTYTASLTLTEGRKIIRPIVTDYAGNALSPATNSSTFVINGQPPIVTLKLPPYGVSSEFTFPFAVETDSIAECRYWSSQTLPPPGFFTALQPFDSTNSYIHTKNTFSEITALNTPYKVFVRCEDPDTGTGSSMFFLTVDKSPPKIITAFAVPNPIVQMPLQTTLKVQTDDYTFCKYSSTTSNYDAMENEFPLFGILGKVSHAVNVTVPSAASYTYTIACKNLAGLGPASKTVSFGVDLSQGLTIKSIVPAYVGNTSIPLGVETNKDTYCYYEQNSQLLPLGGTNSTSMAHTTLITVPGPGLYSIPVVCSTGAGTSAAGIEEKTINVTFFVDLSPPTMVYSDDTSNNPEFPQYSYMKTQLRVAMLGKDNESNVSRYTYLIQEKNSNIVLKNWSYSVILDGLPWWVTGLNLTNGTSYYFRIKSENRAALLSSELPSDGVTIDFSKIPPQCVNQLLDPNETDLDCGGICPPCKDLLKCSINSDCQSRICNATKICQPSLCTDKLNGGNETDIDCGGGVCSTCNNTKRCNINEDCSSGYCASGICTDNPCKNGMLDGLEGDIDCGGACSNKCAVGQTCALDTDCITGASCVNNVCSAIADEDGDGIPDAIDNCPGTPPGEPVDEFGCSASQRHSCGDDIPDSWRILYFGEVLCEGDGAADADPDGDGFTNLEEFLNGTDPFQDDSEGLGWWWLLIIVLLILIAVGVWYYKKKPEEFKRHVQQFRRKIENLVKPEAAPAPKAEVKKAEPHLEDWLSMSDLKKLGPEDVSAKTFNKLDAFIKGKLADHEHAKLLKQLEHEETPLDRLRELALAGLSPKERKALLLKLQLLRKGKLSKEEMEELFRKLRITAAYYQSHKAELEAELEAFVRGEKRKRRR